MNSKILVKKINEIFKNIPNFKQIGNHNFELYGNFGGELLFNYHYLKFKKKGVSRIQNQVNSNLNSLFENKINDIFRDYSFSTGITGFLYIITYFSKKKVIDIDGNLDDVFDSKLKSILNDLIQMGDYDLFRGYIGLAQYYKITNNLVQIDLICNHITQIVLNNQDVTLFDQFYTEKDNLRGGEVINFGFSHGIPAILSFFIQCIKLNVNKTNCEAAGSKLITYIINNKILKEGGNISLCVYPTRIIKYKDGSVDRNEFSRLAWCYGDLMIGFVFLSFSEVVKDIKLRSNTLELLYNISQRKEFSETNISDAGFCHGASGVAHIFNKIWVKTKDPVFKEATDFWIQKTLDFAVHEDGVAGYKKYNPTTKAYENDYGLLEGAAGIGLVLLSYITGDFSWDYCLMLND